MGFERRAVRHVAVNCALLLSLLLGSLAHASVADPRELFRPGAGLASGNAWFGNRIAARGDLLVAGTAVTGGVRGVAYVFREQRGRYVLEAQLQSPLPPPDIGFGGPRDVFGSGVAVDGGQVLVGGTGLFLFTRSGGTWTPIVIESARYWTAVRLAGDRIVGLSSAEQSGNTELCAYERSGGTWISRGCTFQVPVFMSSDLALAFDGTYAAVGLQGTGSRKVSLYRWEDSGLAADAELTRVRASGSSGGNQTVPAGIDHWLALDAGVLALPSTNGVELLRRNGAGWEPAGPSMADLKTDEPIEYTTLDLRDGLLLAVYDTGSARHFRASRAIDGSRSPVALDESDLATNEIGPPETASATLGFFGLPNLHVPENERTIVPVRLDANGVVLRPGEAVAIGDVGEHFGEALAANADRLLVGSFYGGGDETYERRDGVWVPLGRIDPAAGRDLAFLVQTSVLADNGDATVAMGEAWPKPQGYPGELQTYAYGGSGWTLKQLLMEPPEAQGRQFGSSIAINQTTLAVGARSVSQGLGDAVFVYEAVPGGWALKQILEGGVDFGGRLALDGDELALRRGGVIDVYRRGANGWEPESTIAADSSRWAFRHDVLALGARDNNDRGYARVIERTPTGWDRSFDLEIPAEAAPNWPPTPAFDGNTVRLAIDRFAGGELQGRSGVLTYLRNAEGWQLDSVLAGPEVTGHDVALVASGGRVMLGSPKAVLGDVPDVGRVTTFVPESESLALPPSTGGIWYDPSRSGEGWMFELLPDNRAFTIWFTYPEAGSDAEQAWVLGQGVRDGNRIVFEDAITTSGPMFGAGYDAAQLRFHSFGRMEFVFGACGTGVMSYRTREGVVRTRELRQLSALANVPCAGAASQGAHFDGTWYDPARTGEGVLLQFPQPDRAIATWFTYDELGRQAWLIGDGHRDGSTVTFNVVRPVGTSFGDAFDGGDVVRQAFGTWTLHLTDCTHATLDYASPDPAFGSGSRQFVRLTQPEGTACP